MNAGPPHGRPKKGSLPASLEQHEKPSLEASAGATIRLGVDPHATNPRGAPRRVANIAPGGKASSAKGARIDSPYRPLLTAAARPSTFAVRATDETGAVRETPIAGEHPLTLYVDKHELVTLMTLGAAPEALAIGYLRNQRLLERIEDIVAVQVDWDVSAVVVKTRHGLANIEAKTQKRTTTSGCGQGTMFGDLMEEIDKVRLPTGATLSQPTLYALLDRVRVHETIYKQAGAVHGCALATNEPAKSEILIFVEDVGRHNAVDAIAGQMWLDRIDGGDKIFYTTGRLTSEMVIKAAQMGIPFLVSRSGLTQMGHEIAEKVGITLIGRATNKHYLLFTGGERFRSTN